MCIRDRSSADIETGRIITIYRSKKVARMQRRVTSKKRTKEAEKEVDMEEKEVTSVEEIETMGREEAWIYKP